MSGQKVYRAIGLMSGTSLDAVDVALIETDGESYIEPLDFASFPYEPDDRRAIRDAFGKKERDERVLKAEMLVTETHIKALQELEWKADIIGFHGQTIYHNADESLTIQIGDGERLASRVGINVVSNFRKNDVMNGGQGAPLLPLYHYARLKADGKTPPVAVLNIGGVANITYIGESEEDLLAFDTGPGNALIDDFVSKRTGADFDKEGELAFQGSVDQDVINKWLADDHFFKQPPKSLDRDQWDVNEIDGMSTQDGTATLSEFTVQSIMKAHEMLPGVPREYLVSGGGRHNEYIMRTLARALEVPFKPVEAQDWNGDAIEAEGFAYFAVRHLLDKPITFPGTTGVKEPLIGGVLNSAKEKAA